jgi:hypothetical protein
MRAFEFAAAALVYVYAAFVAALFVWAVLWGGDGRTYTTCHSDRDCPSYEEISTTTIERESVFLELIDDR